MLSSGLPTGSNNWRATQRHQVVERKALGHSPIGRNTDRTTSGVVCSCMTAKVWDIWRYTQGLLQVQILSCNQLGGRRQVGQKGWYLTPMGDL